MNIILLTRTANAAYLWPAGDFSLLLLERSSEYQAVLMHETDPGHETDSDRRVVAFGSACPAISEAYRMLLSKLSQELTGRFQLEMGKIKNAHVLLAGIQTGGWVDQESVD